MSQQQQGEASLVSTQTREEQLLTMIATLQ